MSVHWESIEVGLHWYAAQVADDREVLHTDPTPYDARVDAAQAVVRLNSRPETRVT